MQQVKSNTLTHASTDPNSATIFLLDQQLKNDDDSKRKLHPQRVRSKINITSSTQNFHQIQLSFPSSNIYIFTLTLMKKNSSSTQQIALVTATISVSLLLIIMIAIVTGVTQYGRVIVNPKSRTKSGFHRKLLLHDNSETGEVLPNRIWGDKCSKSDIVINQGPTSPLPNGIPTYTVEIMNVCTTGCDISDIHLSCGWFSSARLINPHLFKRLSYNDCLVNDGNPLMNGRTVSFQYANTFAYPLSISSLEVREEMVETLTESARTELDVRLVRTESDIKGSYQTPRTPDRVRHQRQKNESAIFIPGPSLRQNVGPSPWSESVVRYQTHGLRTESESESVVRRAIKQPLS
ncbi:hypothetical protein LXL04_009342 [Taraxacum kok-saghyz]